MVILSLCLQVIRQANGTMLVRELTGTVVVGQQEPHRRVPAPNSKDARCGVDISTDLRLTWLLEARRGGRTFNTEAHPAWPCREIEERRLTVHVFRELRRRQQAADKKGAGGGEAATVTVAELREAFPQVSDTIIRARLRERCDCVPLKARLQKTWRQYASGSADAPKQAGLPKIRRCYWGAWYL